MLGGRGTVSSRCTSCIVLPADDVGEVEERIVRAEHGAVACPFTEDALITLSAPNVFSVDFINEICMKR